MSLPRRVARDPPPPAASGSRAACWAAHVCAAPGASRSPRAQHALAPLARRGNPRPPRPAAGLCSGGPKCVPLRRVTIAAQHDRPGLPRPAAGRATVCCSRRLAIIASRARPCAAPAASGGGCAPGGPRVCRSRRVAIAASRSRPCVARATRPSPPAALVGRAVRRAAQVCVATRRVATAGSRTRPHATRATRPPHACRVWLRAVRRAVRVRATTVASLSRTTDALRGPSRPPTSWPRALSLPPLNDRGSLRRGGGPPLTGAEMAL